MKETLLWRLTLNNASTGEEEKRKKALARRKSPIWGLEQRGGKGWKEAEGVVNLEGTVLHTREREV